MSWRWQRRWTGGLEAVLFDLAGTLQDFGSCARGELLVRAAGAPAPVREVAA